jgi:hypothetical protein
VYSENLSEGRPALLRKPVSFGNRLSNYGAAHCIAESTLEKLPVNFQRIFFLPKKVHSISTENEAAKSLPLFSNDFLREISVQRIKKKLLGARPARRPDSKLGK